MMKLKLPVFFTVLIIIFTLLACEQGNSSKLETPSNQDTDTETTTPTTPGADAETSTPSTPGTDTTTPGTDMEDSNTNDYTEEDPFASVTGVTREVSSWEELLTEMNNPNVTTITLLNNISTPQEDDSPVVLGTPNRWITINGNEKNLTIKSGGIVLGGNIQFLNITLGFSNTVRNAIIANGYNLTLNSVKQAAATSSQSIHLFCGDITNYTGSNKDDLPTPGNHGQIVIKGSNNKLGHIFAGSLDDAANEESAKNNQWTRNSTITWQPGATGTVGIIYAHGARESRGETTGNELYPNSSKYQCTGMVQINISNSAKPDTDILNLDKITIEGATGGSLNASVRYTDNGNGYQSSPLLKNIGGLELVAGTNKANLAPATGSSFQETAKLIIPANTELHLTNLTTSVAVGSLSGGGILVLNQQQKLSISGEVPGTTQLAIGGLSNNRQNSTNQPKQGHSYISASQSEDSSFNLLPPVSTTNETFTLERDQTGNWSVTIEEESTRITEFSLAEPTEISSTEVVIPINVTYNNGTGNLISIPVTIAIKKDEENIPVNQNESGTYILTLNGAKKELFFTYEDNSDKEILYMDPLPAGNYEITVTIPASHSSTGTVLTSTKEFTVSQN